VTKGELVTVDSRFSISATKSKWFKVFYNDYPTHGMEIFIDKPKLKTTATPVKMISGKVSYP